MRCASGLKAAFVKESLSPGDSLSSSFSLVLVDRAAASAASADRLESSSLDDVESCVAALSSEEAFAHNDSELDLYFCILLENKITVVKKLDFFC